MFTEYDYQNQPIVDIVNNMLIDAARKRASDIHTRNNFNSGY